MAEYANAGAALGAGLNAGANFGDKIIGANREREQHGQEETARQAASTDAAATLGGPGQGTGDPTAPPAPADANAHIGFLQSLGQSLSHVGTGISNYFGAQPKGALPPPGATGAPPAGALPPQGGAIPTGIGQQPTAVMGVQPNGGPTPTANVPGGVAMMADGGPVEPGGYANPGAALAGGLNSGADFASKVTGAAREREQHGLDQADRANVAQYVAGSTAAPPAPGMSPTSGQPGAPPAPGAAPGTPPIPANANSPTGPVASAQAAASPDGGALPPTAQSHVDHIEAFAGHLVSGALPDAGTQSGTAPIPPPGGPQTALAAAAQNPAAAKGIPEKGDSDSTAVPGSATSSGAPAHSLTTDYWDKSDALLSKAVQAAALAGHDPDQTYTALNHMRTSFIQGHMLRNLSAANVALQNGDQAGVETALKDMNYYLPNGQNLVTQKDAQGNLVYQNPLQPYVGPDGAPTDAKSQPGVDGKVQQNQPNMIPVDAAHLQMLGQSVLDPMKVNDVLVGARSAAAKMQLERAQAQGVLLTGQGAEKRGEAAISRAAVQEGLAPSSIYRNTAQAAYYAARATEAIKNGQGGKPDQLSYRAGVDATKAVMDMQQGLTTTVPSMTARVDKNGQPVMGPDGKPLMDPSMAPNAGRTERDPSKVPTWLQGKTPDQIGQIGALAGEIGAANHGTMPPQKAAQIAGQIYSHQGTTHLDPATKKPTADVKFSKDRTQGWAWNGTGWDNFAISKRTGGSLAGGNVDIVQPYSGATGPSTQPADSLTPDNPLDTHLPEDPEDTADDNAPAT